jgi:hypothetical protein
VLAGEDAAPVALLPKLAQPAIMSKNDNPNVTKRAKQGFFILSLSAYGN